jgi:Flp pilus assembly protein TadD
MNRKMRRALSEDIGRQACLAARPLPAKASQAPVSGIVAQLFGEAVRCQQSGQFAEAIALYDRIVLLNPNIAEIYNNRGTALAALEKFGEADAAYRRAIQLNPNYADALNNLGNALCRSGELDTAERALRNAVKLNPRSALFRTNLGLLFQNQGRCADAEAAHREALALDPELPAAYANLGETLSRLGRLDEAEQSLRRAISLNRAYPEAFASLAVMLKRQGRMDEAETACRRAIALRPRFPEAHNNLGNILFDQGKLGDAEKTLRQALALRPHFAEAMSNLGNTLHKLGRLVEAETAYRQAVTWKPDAAEAHYNFGNLLVEQDRLTEAEAAYRHAIALKPDFADAHNGLGAALKFLGRFADARRSVERSLQLSPRNTSYLLNLSELKNFDTGDPDLASLEELASTIESLPIKQQIDLHFALAKAYDDLGRHDRTMRHLLTGNALMRAQIPYDEAFTLREFDRIEAVFTPELMRTFAGAGHPSSLPVFIVGMPRSGTTLIEQIIASHPQAFGGGELSTLNALAARIGAVAGSAGPFPDTMAHIQPHDLERAGAHYVAEITRMAPNAVRITDKMPSNFRLAGLIQLISPNARMIHAVRDPLDTCFSCFSKLFANGQYQTFDLAELGRYYRRYQRMMDHWRRVLPAGRIMDVRYEDLVTDLEGQARRIVAYCGLEWDDRCLAFHNTDRAVHTASAVQVRQPIYRNALGRAQPFRAFVQPLLDALSAPDDEVAQSKAAAAKC